MRFLSACFARLLLDGGVSRRRGAEESHAAAARQHRPQGNRPVPELDRRDAHRKRPPVCYAFTRAGNENPATGTGPVLSVTDRPTGRDAVAISGGPAYPKDASITVQVDQAGSTSTPPGAMPSPATATRRSLRSSTAPPRSPESPRPAAPTTLTFNLDGFSRGARRHRESLPGAALMHLSPARPDRRRTRTHPRQIRAVRSARRRSLPTDGASSSACRAPNSPPRSPPIGEAPFRARQLWHWIYHRGGTDFARMSTIARPMQAKLADALRDRPPGSRPSCRPAPTTPANSCSASATGRRPRPSISPTRTRIEARSASPPRSAARLSCRFCHTGTQTPDPQFGRRRDRRPVHGGPRCLRRMAEPERRDAAPALYHRPDGDGRAAVQLRQRRQGDDHRDG